MHSAESAPHSAQITSLCVDPHRRTQPGLCSVNRSHDGWVSCKITIANAAQKESPTPPPPRLPAPAARVVWETSGCTAPRLQSRRIVEDCGSLAKKHSEILITKIKDVHHSCTGSWIHVHCNLCGINGPTVVNHLTAHQGVMDLKKWDQSLPQQKIDL